MGQHSAPWAHTRQRRVQASGNEVECVSAALSLLRQSACRVRALLLDCRILQTSLEAARSRSAVLSFPLHHAAHLPAHVPQAT